MSLVKPNNKTDVYSTHLTSLHLLLILPHLKNLGIPNDDDVILNSGLNSKTYRLIHQRLKVRHYGKTVTSTQFWNWWKHTLDKRHINNIFTFIAHVLSGSKTNTSITHQPRNYFTISHNMQSVLGTRHSDPLHQADIYHFFGEFRMVSWSLLLEENRGGGHCAAVRVVTFLAHETLRCVKCTFSLWCFCLLYESLRASGIRAKGRGIFIVVVTMK